MNGSGKVVPTANVTDFMRKNRFELFGREVFRDAFGNKYYGAQKTEDAGFQAAFARAQNGDAVGRPQRGCSAPNRAYPVPTQPPVSRYYHNSAGPHNHEQYGKRIPTCRHG